MVKMEIKGLLMDPVSNMPVVIHLSRAGATWTVDSRPSDAIALALRCQSEIFVEEEVLEKSKTLRADGDPDPERLKKWLEEVNPEDLGKYRM